MSRAGARFGDGDGEDPSLKVYLLFKNLSFQMIQTYKDKTILVSLLVIHLNAVL